MAAQLVLRTNKASYAPFEPIVVEYWVHNASAAAVSVPGLIDAMYGAIKFEIADEAGEFQRYRTGVQATGFVDPVILKPGDRLASQVIMVTSAYGRLARTHRAFAGAKVFPFSEPGKYKVRATYPLGASDGTDSHPRLASNTVEFSVREASEVEGEALAFFPSLDEYAAAVGGDSEVVDIPAAMERWAEFVDRYPNSVYAPPVRLQLGELYLDGTGMPEPDPGRAAIHFRAAAESGGRALGDDALLGLAKSQIEVGRANEAQAALAKLLEQYPDSEQRARAIRLRDGLAAGWRTLRDIYGN